MSVFTLVVGLLVFAVTSACGRNGQPASFAVDEPVSLPALPEASSMGLEEAIESRRSVRDYTDEPIGLDVVGRLLWSAQGITQRDGPARTAPSAGGTYPLEIYAATSEGMLRYVPEGHRAQWLAHEDLRPALHVACLEQRWVLEAPLVVVITGVVERTAVRYGERAELYVILEADHAAQNMLLQATALGLGAVPIGAFHDDQIVEILQLSEGERPLYVISVGHPAP